MAWRGAILGSLMMFGAICMHLTLSEINIEGDGGLMFASCCSRIIMPPEHHWIP